MQVLGQWAHVLSVVLLLPTMALWCFVLWRARMMSIMVSMLLIGRLANSSAVNAAPTAEITQPAAPPAPLPQSFKCEKCGAAFDDEGAAAAHIQTCKGPEEMPLKEVAS